MFSMQSVSENPLIATFHVSSAASLNLGRSQNGRLLGNESNSHVYLSFVYILPTFVYHHPPPPPPPAA